MPLTHEEAEEQENRSQDEAGHPEGQPSFETPGLDVGEDFATRVQDIRSFLEATPEDLLGGELGGTRETPVPGPEEVSNIEEILDQIGEDLSGLDNQQLLTRLVQTMRESLQLQTNQFQIEATKLNALYDILGSVEPFTRVTVSGVNVIESDEDGIATPVVPQSDQASINTRILFIKASDQNGSRMAIGDDEVSPNDGWILHAGEHIVLNINLASQILWMAGQEGDAVELLGVR